MGAGRPSSFKPEYIEQAEKLARFGMTDAQMAQVFDVAESTFHLWKTQHPKFSEALKRGKDLSDAEVVQSLYRRALGYSHPEDDIRTVSLGDGQGSEIVITPTIKHYPPDTTACIFWLKNRQRDKWREKQESETPEDLVSALSAAIKSLPN
ncbi:MAG TPA: terminase [Limnobacter sp.]|nr:terminase [Limnobacter sp.]